MSSPSSRPSSALLTFTIVAASAVCFSSKGVMAKAAYRHGADALTVLGLRMLLATPIFLITAWIGQHRSRLPLEKGDGWRLLGLGFLGYYLSSVMNFVGLQFISAGLERMILYAYPTLVVLGGWMMGRGAPTGRTLLACGLAYGGIVLAFAGEVARPHATPGHIALGAGLVFASAVTYAAFILLSGPVVQRVGAARFTSLVSGASGLMVMLHLLVTGHGSTLLTQPRPVYQWAVAIALFGTLLPSYLLGFGLRRAGPQRFAVISSVGPLMTLLLANGLLGETVTLAQAAGFSMSLLGGLAVSLTGKR
ncbi:MAG: EamA family transporter [Verrucomicrobiales bacterium]|nr:EamA family transporter [Verrucomicrobiales bacterium]